jgi:tetratricopeptide (TPR) repeat protein
MSDDDTESVPHAPNELQARLAAAGVTDEASLQAALEHDPQLAEDYAAALQALLAENPQLMLAAFLQEFLQVGSSADLVGFWQQVPTDMEQPFLQYTQEQIAQADAQGNTELSMALGQRLEGLRQILAQQQAAQHDPALAELSAAIDQYLALRRTAENDEHNVDAWQATVAAGEALHTSELDGTPGVNWEELRYDLASAYTNLSIAHEQTGLYEESLAATERAIVLQPDFAMWQRNRAGALIDLKRLDEAEAALAEARRMEPDAPRLIELAESLAQARLNQTSEEQQ